MLRRLVLLTLTAALIVGSCTQSDDAASDETTSTASTAATTTAAPTTGTPTTPTSTTTSAGATTELRLTYAAWEEQPLTLDMRVPAESSGAPIVIYLPGRGATSAPVFVVEDLVEEGAIVFVVRFAGTGQGPEAILSDRGADPRAKADSVACAIRFARARASELGSDDPVVALAGFSLGGGVAAHVALWGANLEARWDEFAAEGGPPRMVECEVTDGSTHVDALVGMAGRYDVFVPIYDGVHGRAYQQERDPELWEFLSSSIGANPDLQIRLIHGESDDKIPFENSVGFAAGLTDAGYNVGEVIPFEGGHQVPPELAVPTIVDVIGP